MRAPFQVLVIPFRAASGRTGDLEYCAFKRSDNGVWQFIAGGGEEGESTPEAARREAMEEAGISAAADLFRLQSVAQVPREEFPGNVHWPADLAQIPEYSFGIDSGGAPLALSGEHTDLRWGSCREILQLLHFESNRAALRELALALGDFRASDEH